MVAGPVEEGLDAAAAGRAVVKVSLLLQIIIT
jgi:hypothetical protein